MKRIFVITSLVLFSNLFFSQSEKKIPIEHYFKVVDSLEVNKLKLDGIIDMSNKIAEKYKAKDSETLNEIGFEKLTEIRAEVYAKYFKDYLLLQSLEYKNDIYAFYFSVAGFDDVEFQILKWKKENWDGDEKVDKKVVIEKNSKIFENIAFNYDEGPKNLENPRIFIQNNYLVMERSGIYHSLYDLKSNKLLINEESPWHLTEETTEESLKKWIKENLHDKIQKKLANNDYR